MGIGGIILFAITLFKIVVYIPIFRYFYSICSAYEWNLIYDQWLSYDIINLAYQQPTRRDASSILVRSKNERAAEFKIGVSQQSTRSRRIPEPVYYNKLHSFNVLYIVIHLCFCCCCFSRSIRLNWLKRQIRRGCRRVGLGSLADDPHQPIYYYYEYYWSIEMRRDDRL